MSQTLARGGFSLSRKAIGQASSARKLIPPLALHGGSWQYLKRRKSLFAFWFSCSLSISFTHGLSFCCTYTDTRRAVPCGECLTYAIQLAGYFCLVWVGSGVTQQALSSAEGELWKPVTNKQRDSLPASHSQMANLGRIRNTLYNQI